MSAYLDEGQKFYKPLSLTDRLLIDTVTTRYESVEAPFIAIDKGDHIELRHSATIRRVAPYETNETPAISAQAIPTTANGGL